MLDMWFKCLITNSQYVVECCDQDSLNSIGSAEISAPKSF